MELCFGIERFDGFAGSGLGVEVFTGIVIGMGDNPRNSGGRTIDRFNRCS